jgi:hypothetical protein
VRVGKVGKGGGAICAVRGEERGEDVHCGWVDAKGARERVCVCEHFYVAGACYLLLLLLLLDPRLIRVSRAEASKVKGKGKEGGE